MTKTRRSSDGGTAEALDGAIRAEFNWSDVPPSTAVIETVAIAADCDPMALEPLYDTIDPDALDTLIGSGETRSTDGTVTVSFTLDGYEATVQRDGTVVVRSDGAGTETE